MTVGKKIALLPLIAVLAIVMVALVMIRDIGSVFDSASYGTVNTIPSLVVLDAMEMNLATARVNIWQHVARKDAAVMALDEHHIADAPGSESEPT